MNDAKQAQVASVAQPEDGQGSFEETRTQQTLDPKTRVRRVFSFAQIFFFSLTYMSSWETQALNLSASLYNGGPRALSIGSLIVIAGALAQSASLAEMSSAVPTAGAQYHWVWEFARTSRYRRFLSWMQGWITWFAWVSTLAGVCNTTAFMLQNLAATSYPAYTPEPWHITLIILALLLVLGLMNQFAWFVIPWFELLAGVLHVVLFVIFAAVLLSLSPRNSTDFVFTAVQDEAGWDNPFVSWNLAMITPLWGFVGFDGMVHLSEEVKSARHNVPRAMFYTIVINGVLAWGFILILLYSLGDIEDALSAPFPIIEICTQATGSTRAAVAMVCGLMVISTAVTLGSISSASRLTWAWSRDGGLPAFFAKISPTYHIPTRSIWLPVLVVAILSLLNVGTASSAAFNAFIALSSFTLYASYAIAIGSALRAKVRGEMELGEWNLGRSGMLINIFALLYTLWMMVFLTFPATLPVTGANMNYALPIFTAVFVYAILHWLVSAGKNWPGLNRKVIDAVLADADRKTAD